MEIAGREMEKRTEVSAMPNHCPQNRDCGHNSMSTEIVPWISGTIAYSVASSSRRVGRFMW
jgi:hypothetical protein